MKTASNAALQAASSRTRPRLGLPASHRAASGQAAIEVMSYAGFFLLVFVVTVAVFLQLQNQELARAENAFAQEVAYQFADQIKTASIAGSGFWQNVSLAPTINGKPYKIYVSRGGQPGVTETGLVYVEWAAPSGNQTFSAPTITSSYSALTDGSMITTDADYIIIDPSMGSAVKMENVGGRIIFSKGG
jgi:hypothetical protein